VLDNAFPQWAHFQLLCSQASPLFKPMSDTFQFLFDLGDSPMSTKDH
jgi:hypothetical protein